MQTQRRRQQNDNTMAAYQSEGCEGSLSPTHINNTFTLPSIKKEEKLQTVGDAPLPERSISELLTKIAEDVYATEKELTLHLTEKREKDETLSSDTTSTTTTTISEILSKEPSIVNTVHYEPTAQYDTNGRPYEHPFPPEFLPPVPELSNGEEWQNDVISQEEFDKVAESMCLPSLKDITEKSFVADYVPKEIVQMSIRFLSCIALHGSLAELSRQDENLAKAMYNFYAQFGIRAEDDKGQLANWKTVFYVTHLLRTIPTAEAYEVEEDLFSGSQGMSEYNLNNWHLKRTHAIRMVVISNLSGDRVGAVTTLDLLMRFRRSMNRASHSITFHQVSTETGAPLNQSLCFVNYLNEEGKARQAWINIGLLNKVAKNVPRKLPYHDGPYCKTCIKHHTKLLYCTKCYCTQYCSLKCLKADKNLHTPFCEYNKK